LVKKLQEERGKRGVRSKFQGNQPWIKKGPTLLISQDDNVKDPRPRRREANPKTSPPQKKKKKKGKRHVA